MTYLYPTAFSLWGAEEHAAIQRVVASGNFTMGEEVAAFELEFAAWHGMKHAVMVNSGSSANLIAVAALFHLQDKPLMPGGKVLVPAIAWSTTYSPLVQHDLQLILLDVDDTWNADPKGPRLSREIYGARLIVACSILGNPGHLKRWQEMADGLGAYLLNDNCESLGAGDCGTYGLMSTHSLFWSHQLSAIEGGVILTNSDECANLCRMLRAHGWTRDVKPPQTFADEYDFQLMGYNVRPLEMHAAIAREQLKKLPGFIKARQENYDHFVAATDRISGIQHPRRNGIMSPFGLHFTVPSTEVRQQLVTELREHGIDCRLPTGGSFRRHKYGEPWAHQMTPNADRIHDCGLFLGNAPYDISELIDEAVTVMRRVL